MSEGTAFVGYHSLEQKATIVKLLVDGREVETIEAGQEAGMILDTTPFYGEMGDRSVIPAKYEVQRAVFSHQYCSGAT